MRKIINIALALVLLAGLCVPAAAAGSAFSDVPAGNWAYSYVQRAADQGWVSGVGGGRYAPNSPVTYAQFALLLSKVLYTNDINSQPAGAQWWIAGCEVADRHGLFKGTDMERRSSWNSVANTPIEREQMAQMMYNALVDSKAKLPSYEEYSEVALGINDIIDTDNYDAVATCYTLKLLSGSGGYFNPHDPMTRAQAAVVLCNIYDAVRGSGSDPSPEQPVGPVETPNPFHVYNGGKMIGFQARVRNIVEGNPQSDDEFFFTIVPKEDYSGVIMPDDTTTVIEGTGDATFNEIMFTEPGTYSFLISQEEGMDNYRYDGRTWEVSVTVSGTAGAPAGAVGGHYDISAYDVPADANKDGWITEEEVQTVLDQLKEEYPNRSTYDPTIFWNSPVMGYGKECAYIAFMFSDRIFGNLPKYATTLDSMRIGDVLKEPGHWSMSQNNYGDLTEQYRSINGGAKGIVSWTMLSRYDEWPASGVIYSRYPVGTNTPSTLTVDSAVYIQGKIAGDGEFVQTGSTANTETASFINTCLDTPTWSAETKEKARKIMADMTLEEKVGQLFLLHYPGDGSGTVAQATALIDKYHPGGYLVFASMFENNTTAGVQKKIADTQAASDIPLLFTVDEEGGIAASGNRVVRVSKYPQYGHDPFRSPQELKAAGGLAAVAADAVDKANFLANLGLNVNHAPVADVAGPGGMMYGRTWGGDGLENAKYVETLVEASEGAGMPTTLKHFPGYGGTSSDTHNGFAVNDLSLEDFYYNDLLPFHAGIAAGSRAVMVTHNTINCLDTAKPALAL